METKRTIYAAGTGGSLQQLNWLSALLIVSMIPLSAHTSANGFHVYGSDSTIAFLLEQRKVELLLLQARWRTPLASDGRFNTNTSEAVRIAERLSGLPVTQTLFWVNVTSQEIETRPEPEEAIFDADTVLAQDCIDDLINDDDGDGDDDDDDDDEDQDQDQDSYNSYAGEAEGISSIRELDDRVDSWRAPFRDVHENRR